MADPVSYTLASNTPTSGWRSSDRSDPVLELIGSGSVTLTVEYLCHDGSTYAPDTVATDGGSPTIMNRIAYNGGTQNGIRIALNPGQMARVNPGAVTGSVSAYFAEQ